MSATRPIGLWLTALVLGAVAITVSEAQLLALGTGFFGDGFQSLALGSRLDLAVFLAWSLLIDLALVALLTSLLVPVLRRSEMVGLRAWLVLAVATVGVPCLLAAYRYNVYKVAGEKFVIAFLGGSSMSTSSSVIEELFGFSLLIWVILGLLVALGLVITLRWLGGVERDHPEWALRLPLPPAGVCALFGVLVLCASAALIRFADPDESALRFGINRKGADIVAFGLASILTDPDGDGFGLLTALADPAPFDASRHPHGLEIPGNDIDENGLGGDLPADYEGPQPVRAPIPVAAPHRPHVLLLYLETFRHDLLGLRVNGREATPFLNALAREGASTSHAYVHSAKTLHSRAHLFLGDISRNTGGSTLIDDFKTLGYEVLHFSGQDESYGDSEALLGVERADAFYDARQDIDRRSSKSTTPVSLQVSSKVLEERIAARLKERDPGRSLFLYANLTDTHFPYVHPEIDNLLDVPLMSPGRIQSDRVEELTDSYANTAANVDRGARNIARAFREAIGHEDHAIVVLADHGEAFYENGRLGHGQSVDDVETRIPLIVWGLSGQWPEPVAPSDLRGLLRSSLARTRSSESRVEFVPDPQRGVFQFAPGLGRPRFLGLRLVDRHVVFDMENGTLTVTGQDGAPVSLSPLESDRQRDALIWQWEAIRARDFTAGPGA